jgi:micrococcal nuclease
LSRRKSKKKLIRWVILAILIIVIVSFRLVEKIDRDISPDERFIITKVIDGDTVELKGGDRLRLLTIDTPEKGEPLYDEATQLLTDIALGKTATVEYANRRRDKYGRLLGYLYIDSIFVNKVILEKGLGYLYLFKDTDIDRPETDILFKAQRHAIKTDAGLWSLPRDYEDYYIARVGSLRFHRPGCGSLKKGSDKNNRNFDKRDDALWEGLSPCRNCRP